MLHYTVGAITGNAIGQTSGELVSYRPVLYQHSQARRGEAKRGEAKPLPRVRKPNLHSDRGQDSNLCAWKPLEPQSTHGSTVPLPRTRSDSESW
ncbi:hypothetical protein E2C01_084408 [Portunus trituberculatus]|uniref:Uncharacterized protein n=1 Tax=Portunus trituberculatus TaxID=210409 RepID=A0A5B7J959_PORTR|nr:hypothetical protein [Portunus trituberculatus]